MKKKNWKRLRKQDLPQTVFFAITIISAGLVVLPLWNYTKYYVALGNFDYTLTNVTFYAEPLYPPTSTIVKINITLTASNPTDYSGLQVSTVTCFLEYYGEYDIAQELTSATSPPQSYSIRPNANTTIMIETSFSGNSGTNALDFINYLETLSKEGGAAQIVWSINCRLFLTTFENTYSIPKSFSPVTPWNSSAT
jgi:hypothetical protein